MHDRLKLVLAATVTVAAASAWPAAAQYSKPEDAVKYRQAALTVLGNHMGRIFNQLKQPSPNMQVIQSSAGVVESMSKLPWDAFGHSTEFVTSSRALPALYKNEAKVKELSDRMQDEARKLNVAAQGGDAKVIRTQFGALAKTCDSCHDDFRAK